MIDRWLEEDSPIIIKLNPEIEEPDDRDTPIFDFDEHVDKALARIERSMFLKPGAV